MSQVTAIFDELHTLARDRGLRVVVQLTPQAAGPELLRIRLRDRSAVRYSSAQAAAAGQPLAHQAQLLVDLLRRSPA